jgi:hypothetical protein
MNAGCATKLTQILPHAGAPVGPGTLEQVNVAWLKTPCNFFSTTSSSYEITVPVIHWRPVHNLTPRRGTHVQAAGLAGSALARSVRVQEQEMTTVAGFASQKGD